jgi:hypothetical protein
VTCLLPSTGLAGMPHCRSICRYLEKRCELLAKALDLAERETSAAWCEVLSMLTDLGPVNCP